jgi:hypothetical protein
MIFKSRRAVSQGVAVIIIAVVVIIAISFALLNLSQNAKPPENNVTVTIQTHHAANGVWNGSITVSEDVALISVLIPTETKEISGVLKYSTLHSGTNLIDITFEGLPAGTYEMIFTFRAISSVDEFSVFREVVFL